MNALCRKRNVQAAIVPAALLALCTLGLAGCASPWVETKPQRSVPPSEATRLSITADWNDLDAAVLLASSRQQLAIVESQSDGQGKQFELLSIYDETVWLWAAPSAPHTSHEADVSVPIAITLRARFEPAGDVVRERRLLQAVRTRMEELKGVDVAPAR